MPQRQTQVLVVGGSLVGLSTSVLLASYGVPHLVVESHAGTAIHPRAASFHQRTMEVFRSVGLQAEVEEVAAREFRQGGAIVAVESLAGKELAYFYRSYNDGVEGLSPTDRLFITQVGLEPMLRQRATELGAEHLFGTDLVSFETRDDHVTAVIRPHGGGAEETGRLRLPGRGRRCAQRGPRAAGHTDDRPRQFRRLRHHLFQGRCEPPHGGPESQRGLRQPPGTDGLLQVLHHRRLRLPGRVRDARARTAPATPTSARTSPTSGASSWSAPRSAASPACRSTSRASSAGARWPPPPTPSRAAGSSSPGDAAHVMPPTGGFGGNTGVADAYNLAWKLAYVTRGIAGPGLLDTYGAERRPISALTVEQAYTRYALRVDPSLPSDDLMPPLDDAAIELGAIYRSSAVHADDAPAASNLTTRTRGPGRSVPGYRTSRWPTAAELDAGRRRPGFALLADHGHDRLAASRRARSRTPSALPSPCSRSAATPSRPPPARRLLHRPGRVDRSRADPPRRSHRLETSLPRHRSRFPAHPDPSQPAVLHRHMIGATYTTALRDGLLEEALACGLSAPAGQAPGRTELDAHKVYLPAPPTGYERYQPHPGRNGLASLPARTTKGDDGWRVAGPYRPHLCPTPIARNFR